MLQSIEIVLEAYMADTSSTNSRICFFLYRVYKNTCCLEQRNPVHMHIRLGDQVAEIRM
jgi:hypothetical protein